MIEKENFTNQPASLLICLIYDWKHKFHSLPLGHHHKPDAHGPHSLTWVNSYKSFKSAFGLSVAMATIEKRKYFCKNFIKNIYSEIAIRANFPFSHYKQMDTLLP